MSQADFSHIFVDTNDGPYNSQIIEAALLIKAMRSKRIEAQQLNKKLKTDFFRFIEQTFNAEPLEITSKIQSTIPKNSK